MLAIIRHSLVNARPEARYFEAGCRTPQLGAGAPALQANLILRTLCVASARTCASQSCLEYQAHTRRAATWCTPAARVRGMCRPELRLWCNGPELVRLRSRVAPALCLTCERGAHQYSELNDGSTWRLSRLSCFPRPSMTPRPPAQHPARHCQDHRDQVAADTLNGRKLVT